ncbi:MAG: HAD-IA family hydrolase [Patescibacteria group bacterium]
MRLLMLELHKKGYRLAIVTNNWRGMKEKFLKDVVESTVIEYFFESSNEGMRKPDIQFFKLVEARLDASGEDIFFIDDSDINIESAKSLRWQTFHYILGDAHEKQSNELIRQLLLSP